MEQLCRRATVANFQINLNSQLASRQLYFKVNVTFKNTGVVFLRTAVIPTHRANKDIFSTIIPGVRVFIMAEIKLTARKTGDEDERLLNLRTLLYAQYL